MRQQTSLQLAKDYDMDVQYHLDKVNVVADRKMTHSFVLITK